MSVRQRRFGWIVFWVAVAGMYLAGAVIQKDHVNLSATAGGQYPYLTEAKRMAQEGVANYYGDRNRMPLIPALVSTLFTGDWNVFVARSAWFAVVSSLLLLALLAIIAHRFLPSGLAAVFTLIAAFCVFGPKASFVQAELIYYTLFFSLWLLSCRLVVRPTPRLAFAAGLLFGITYLAKASVLIMLGLFVAWTLCAALIAVMRRASAPTESKPMAAKEARSRLLTGVTVLVGFLLVSFPYLQDNHARYGQWFYNVNSRFFMWCDSWRDAHAFAAQYAISDRYPDVPPQAVPGPAKYWAEHSLGQIGRRLQSGASALWTLARQGPYFKYLVVAVAVAGFLGYQNRARWRVIAAARGAMIAWSVLLWSCYLLVYAWYAPVAFGDRFVLSLFLPAMFAILLAVSELSRHAPTIAVSATQFGVAPVLATALVGVLVIEGGLSVARSDQPPTPAFVGFYFNESAELLTLGRRNEALRGLAGVIRLDPTFSPAHRTLGELALADGRLGDAILHLESATRWAPRDARAQGLLGEVLRRQGDLRGALTHFLQAVGLDRGFSQAWYELGRCFWLLDQRDEAIEVLGQLRNLDPVSAQKLEAIIRGGSEDLP